MQCCHPSRAERSANTEKKDAHFPPINDFRRVSYFHTSVFFHGNDKIILSLHYNVAKTSKNTLFYVDDFLEGEGATIF